MAIYKRGRGFELGTTENISGKSPERDSNPPPDCESDALTTRPRCLGLLHPPASLVAIICRRSSQRSVEDEDEDESSFPSPSSLWHSAVSPCFGNCAEIISLLCVNRSSIRFSLRVGAKAIWYIVNLIPAKWRFSQVSFSH